MIRSSKIDHQKQIFERELLTALGMLTRLPQQTVLQLARKHAEDIWPLYAGECTGAQAAKLLLPLLDAESARNERVAPVSAGWR